VLRTWLEGKKARLVLDMNCQVPLAGIFPLSAKASSNSLLCEAMRKILDLEE